MNCPFCPPCHEYADRPRARLSIWAPLAIIIAVLATAAAASALTDTRDAPRQGSLAIQGRAL